MSWPSARLLAAAATVYALGACVEAHLKDGYLPAADVLVSRSGRFFVFENGSCQADWPASQLAFATTAGNVIMHARTITPAGEFGDMFSIFVGGILSSRLQLQSGVSEYPILSLGSSRLATPVQIQVIKATEANWNAGNSSFRAPIIDGFSLLGGDAFPIPRADPGSSHARSPPLVYPVPPAPANSPRKLLFIGDSLTAGYGDLGFKGCKSLPSNQDWTVTWGARLCAQFDAECHVLAWSGHGLVRNVMGQQPATRMPTRVQQVAGSGGSVEHPWGALPPFDIESGGGLPGGNTWDWSAWTPDAVLINLGTNDWCCNQAPPLDFTGIYKQFVHNVSYALSRNNASSSRMERSEAEGEVPFFLVSGPVSKLYDAAVQEVVGWANAEGLNTSFVQQNGLLVEPGDFGCAGHPSIQGHFKMAQATAPVLQRVLGW